MNTEALPEERERACNEVRVLEEQERAFALTPERIREDLHRRRTLIYALACTLSAISRLPNEILSDILAAASDGDRNVESALVLVSRRWYEVAMDTPALWSNINISEPGLDRITSYLARSRNHMLNVSIFCDSMPLLDHLKPSLAALSRQFGRVRRLSCLGYSDGMLKSLMVLLPNEALSLTELKLGILITTLDNKLIKLFPAGAPQLRQLRLSSVAFSQFIFPLSHITSVSINNSYLLNLPDGFQEILPALVHLNFTSGEMKIRRAPSRVVTIEVWQDDSRMDLVVAWALMLRPETIILRYLETLQMQEAFHRAIPSSVHRQALDNIRTLVLDNCMVTRFFHTPFPFVRALDALTTLVVVDSKPRSERQATLMDVFLRAFAQLDADVVPSILPSLHRLEVRHNPTEGQPTHIGILRDLVRARAAAGVSLVSLALLASHYSQMEPASLAELREEISVEIID